MLFFNRFIGFYFAVFVNPEGEVQYSIFDSQEKALEMLDKILTTMNLNMEDIFMDCLGISLFFEKRMKEL